MKKMMKGFISLLVVAMMIVLVPVQQVHAEDIEFILIPNANSTSYYKNRDTFDEWKDSHYLLFEDDYGATHEFYIGEFKDSETEGMGYLSFLYKSDRLDNKADLLVVETLAPNGGNYVKAAEQFGWDLVNEDSVYLYYEFDKKKYNDEYLYFFLGLLNTETGYKEHFQLKLKNELYFVPITEIKLVKNEDVGIGEQEKLVAQILPSHTTQSKEITWTSSDEAIATVDENGVVTGVSLGTVTITATTVNGISASCEMEVKNAIRSIAFEHAEYNEIHDGEMDLRLLFNPDANVADMEEVFWEIENKEVLDFSFGYGEDEFGSKMNFRTMGPGSTKVKATAPNGITASTIVNIDAPVLGFSMGVAGVEIYVTRSFDYGKEAYVLPHNANHEVTVSWSSSDETIATVDENGVVTGLVPGTVVITGTTSNGLSDSRKVVILDDAIKAISFGYKSTINSGEMYDCGKELSFFPEQTRMDKTVVWSSSNEKVAVVDQNGRVTGVSWGSAIITATAVNGVSSSSRIEVRGAFPRLYGDNRYDTAFKVADAVRSQLGGFSHQLDAVVIVNGTNFADALAGSFLAAEKGAPILMTDKSERAILNVKSYINLHMKETGTVYILGGTAAVSSQVEEVLQPRYTVKRLAGDNRYATNMAIVNEVVEGTYSGKLLVCTGTNFADSLSVSATGLPIMLVGKGFTDEQLQFIKANDITEAIIVGGVSAVGKDIEKVLKNTLPTNVSVNRLAGANRYETSIMVADRFFPTANRAVLAYAQNYPDGLSGGALAYAFNAPLILTDGKNYKVASKYANSKNVVAGYVLGGPKLVTEEAKNAIFGLDN